jgi:predicted  nucleic acid-binding Zn-ribbon protein
LDQGERLTLWAYGDGCCRNYFSRARVFGGVVGKSIAERLFEVARIDERLFRLERERALCEREFRSGREAALVARRDRERVLEIVAAKQGMILRGEKELKEDFGRIEARRAAVSSFGNAKVQKNAQMEIDHAVSMLRKREDAVLVLMEEVEALKHRAEELEKKQNEEGARGNESLYLESLEAMEDRAVRLRNERSGAVEGIDAAILQVYERARLRYPVEPMARVDNGACAVCRMGIAPRLMVDLHKPESVVKCAGCSRILYLSVSEV